MGLSRWYKPVAGQDGSWSVTLPPGLTPGTYYLGAIVDPTNAAYNDPDRGNNVAVDQIEISLP